MDTYILFGSLFAILIFGFFVLRKSNSYTSDSEDFDAKLAEYKAPKHKEYKGSPDYAGYLINSRKGQDRRGLSPFDLY